MSKNIGCPACNAYGHGAKSRIAFEHSPDCKLSADNNELRPLFDWKETKLYIIGKTLAHTDYFVKRLMRENLLESRNDAVCISNDQIFPRAQSIRGYKTFVIVLAANYEGQAFEEMFYRFAGLKIKNISVDDQISIPQLKETIIKELTK